MMINATKSIIAVSTLALIAVSTTSCHRNVETGEYLLSDDAFSKTLRVAEAVIHELMGEDQGCDRHCSQAQPETPVYQTYPEPQPYPHVVYTPEPSQVPAASTPCQNQGRQHRPNRMRNHPQNESPNIIDAILNRDPEGPSKEAIGGAILRKILSDRGIN